MSESPKSDNSRLVTNLGTATISGVVAGVGLAWLNVVTGTEGFLFAGGAALTGFISVALTWLEHRAKNN